LPGTDHILTELIQETDHLEGNIRLDLGERGREVWNGCIWLRIGTSVNTVMNFGFFWNISR